MKLIRLALLGGVALAIALGGCSQRHAGDPLGPRTPSTGDPVAPGDTVPKPPPPPPTPSVPLVVCVGFDSTQAGTTGITHWRFANDSTVAITVHWSVTAEAGWPGFPVTGTVALDPQSTKLVNVAIAVPASAAACQVYALHMTATLGGLDYFADGVIRVFGPCPPEPPPVISPVEFFGSDSTQAGQTGLSHWRLGNNNDQPFTMHWTLTSEAGWPGFPIQGSVTLPARSVVPLDVPITVPAGTAPSYYALEMQVDDPAGGIFTRPGSIGVWQ